MARYGQAFRDRAVARMLPPESAPVAELARELGVAAQTLERWRSDSLTRPARERAWSANRCANAPKSVRPHRAPVRVPPLVHFPAVASAPPPDP